MRGDRSGALSGIAVLTGLFSVALGPFSVHTYCENRPFVGVCAIAAVILIVLLIQNRPLARWRRIVWRFGLAICLLTTAMNIWFIWYATGVCRHMLDLVNP
jgi:hypothetical protein